METESELRIDRREGLSYDGFVEQYLRPRRPVVITDAIRRWGAMSKWTPDFFRTEFGSKEVTISNQRYKLGDFIDLVENSTPEKAAPYLRNESIREMFPELAKDIEPCPAYLFPNWLSGRFYPGKVNSILNRCCDPEIYIGGAGGRFPFLHYDLYHTHACLNQIYGRKSFVAYAPEQAAYLYPKKDARNRSTIEDLEHPDLDRYPLFAKAVPMKFTLEPGETLFIPAGWWHTAKILTASITVSVNLANSSNWGNLVRDLRHSLKSSDSSLTRLVSTPVAAYLTGFGMLRSLRGS